LPDYAELGDAQRQQMDDYFVNQIQPVLTPLAFHAESPLPFNFEFESQFSRGDWQ
jgi:polyphosphate kinase